MTEHMPIIPDFTIPTLEFLSFLATSTITAKEDVWIYTPEERTLTALSSTGSVIGKIDAYPLGGDLGDCVINLPVEIIKVIQSTWKTINSNYVKAQREHGNKDAEHAVIVSVRETDLVIKEHVDCVPVGLRPYTATVPINIGDTEGLLERIFTTLDTPHSDEPVSVPIDLAGTDLGVLSAVSAKHDKEPVVFLGKREDGGWNLRCGDWEGVLIF